MHVAGRIQRRPWNQSAQNLPRDLWPVRCPVSLRDFGGAEPPDAAVRVAGRVETRFTHGNAARPPIGLKTPRSNFVEYPGRLRLGKQMLFNGVHRTEPAILHCFAGSTVTLNREFVFRIPVALDKR